MVPASFVCTKNKWVNGPTPMIVSAATTHTYVVYGSSPVIVILVTVL